MEECAERGRAQSPPLCKKKDFIPFVLLYNIYREKRTKYNIEYKTHRYIENYKYTEDYSYRTIITKPQKTNTQSYIIAELYYTQKQHVYFRPGA